MLLWCRACFQNFDVGYLWVALESFYWYRERRRVDVCPGGTCNFVAAGLFPERMMGAF